MVSLGRTHRAWLFVAALGLATILSLGAAPIQPANKPKGSAEAAQPMPKAKADGEKGPSAFERESLAVDRAANSIGERANRIAEAQRVYGLIQLFFAAFGVIFTGLAAFFAWRATHWAKEAAQAARKSAEADNETLAETRSASEEARQAAAQQAKWTREQLKLMDHTMRFTADSAFAMEGVAKSMALSAKAAQDSVATVKERTAQQMRAYVTVQTGDATYQERDKNLYFEGRPIFLNTGATPAHRLRFRAHAQIMDIAKIEEFAFPLSGEVRGGATLNAQQTFVVGAKVEYFVPDQDVAAIKAGHSQAMVVWGVLTYEDIFKEEHKTQFSLIYTWRGDGQIMGYWTRVHNESD